MALNTLKNVKKIGKFTLIDMGKLREENPEKFNESGGMDYQWFEKDVRPNHFIYLRHDVNSISFTLQNGPIKENGVNGCQVDDIIHVAKIMLEGLNLEVPCRENALAITKLDEALLWLMARKIDREIRRVEGTSSK